MISTEISGSRHKNKQTRKRKLEDARQEKIKWSRPQEYRTYIRLRDCSLNPQAARVDILSSVVAQHGCETRGFSGILFSS
jgi:hypothetical protein